MTTIPRFLPHVPFPPYTYVTGQSPHPTRDQAGHSFGCEVVVDSFDPQAWQQCEAYLFAIDLYNHGFFWESHEQWEAAWIAIGRAGTTADFLKGLIKLSAAGVKRLEGRPNGVARHGQRAVELFTIVSESHAAFCGLSLSTLIDFATRLSVDTDTDHEPLVLQ